MTKLDLIKLIIDFDDDLFEELNYADWNLKFVEKLLLLGDKIGHIGEIDKISYIEISNEVLFVEPKGGYEFTSFDSCDSNETYCLNYRWKIKKVK